ncbi:Na+/H+ antiporter subunit A [Vallicoccus soli]|uniref:Na+/H+ antiporter subunit A n=1 Tax=Vallicoccus soli TaxID=2339232 RepID=A0A3A3YZ87_9ACTN|nr:Na+/H+ antiporter subunit A [Vallicoccus soli]
MLTLLAAHAVAALVAPLLVRAAGRRAFLALALVPAASCAALLARAGGEVREAYSWIPSLDVAVALRTGPLPTLLAALVTGVGALVLVYCSRYFGAASPGLARFAGVLVAFAGAMLGLVLADDVLLLYVCWELTTVFSYLLIGHSARLKAARRAAMQALVVTTSGGLAMLVGLIALAVAGGTTSLSGLVADPPRGTVVTVAVVLVLLGALTKSALLPFHFWLPAAMAAPTPVSAYLHAAAMVKGGVFLVGVLAPGFADVPGWRPLVVGLGLATMLVGAWTALRQTDLKLLLAHGTVSQLGFLMVLLGAGTRDAALAGAAMLLAHALFKSSLFLVVGVVDRCTGTRDLRRLDGLGRRLPVLAVTGALAAASMAGVPPLVGFVGKEAAYEAYLHDALPSGAGSAVVLAGLVTGSALTAAYSLRFVWGAFARKPGAGAVELHAPAAVAQAVPALLALAGLAAGLAATALDRPLAAYARALPAAAAEDYHLALWHGPSPALGLSLVSLGGGALLFAGRGAVQRVQVSLRTGLDADRSYRSLMRWVDRASTTVTAATQRGSLPVYLGTIVAVLVVLTGYRWAGAVAGGGWPDRWRAWDNPLQVVVAVLVLAAALAAARSAQRLTAVLLVGVTGYGTGVLFALHGAPDLALTQFLVETVTLVVFVLVLRTLPKQIVDRHTRAQRRGRLLVAVPAGLLMAGTGALALGAREAPAVSLAFPSWAYEYGGGRNVVNVTLVDIRAWDTLGEISVLVVAATGVASLVFLRGRTGGPPRLRDEESPPLPAPAVTERSSRLADTGAHVAGAPWLRGGGLLPSARRSIVLEIVTRAVFHTVVVLSVYLLFAGHNAPGGGFAGGLVAGLALVVRYLAGGRYELGEAAPVDAGLLLGAGLLLAGGTGAAGLLLGADVLQTTIVEGALPVFGDVKLVTSLFFDVGVYLVVVGLVLDVLRSLGAEVDRREHQETTA